MSQQQAYAQPPAPRPFELDVEKLRDLERQNKLPVFTTFQDHADGDFTVIVAGKGVYLWDAEGNQYLDGCSGIGNVGLGYDQTEIADAVHAQMKTLPFHLGGWNFSTPPSIELAAKLTQHAPDGLNRVIFVSGGSEANETVIKVSRLYFRLRGFEKKTTAIALDRSYHGATYGAASLTGLPHMHEHFEPMLSKVRHIPTPYRYRCEQCGTQPACTLACADMLEKVILEEGPETVAFFIAEPVLGGGGGIPLPPEYFQRIRAICDKYDVLMVSDEVITGFGRTGKMFAIEHAGVIPDMISTAKGINSGYLPLGAVLLHEKIYDTFLQAPEGTDFSHGYTNSGHPVCCAAGLKTLEIIQPLEIALRAKQRACRVTGLCQSEEALLLYVLSCMQGVAPFIKAECVFEGDRVEVLAEERNFSLFHKEQSTITLMIYTACRDDLYLALELSKNPFWVLQRVEDQV